MTVTKVVFQIILVIGAFTGQGPPLKSAPVYIQKPNNDTIQARIWEETAEKSRREGSYSEASRYFLDAATIYSNTNRWEDYIDALNGAGDCFRFAGDLQRAQETVKMAIDTFNDHFEAPDQRLAGCYHTLGIIKDYLGQFDQAIEINQKALNIFLENDGDSVSIGKVFNSLGVNYLHKSDHYRSLENQLKALEIYKQHLEPRDQQIANLYLNLGATYLDLDKYDLAREYFEQEMSITMENLGGNHPYVGETSSNLGVVHSRLGNFDLAEEYFLRSEKIFVEHFGTKNPSLIEVYHNLGLLNSNAGKFEKAIYYFGECDRVINQNPGMGNIDIARLNLSLSLNYLEMGEPLQAQSYANKAKELLEVQVGHKNPLLARCYLSLARSAGKLQKIDQALEFCQQGLISNTADFSNVNIETNPSGMQSLSHGTFRRLLEIKAGLFQQQYQEYLQIEALENALQTLRLADQLITEIRRERLSIEDKLQQATRTNEVYSKAVEICFTLFDLTRDRKYLEEAFMFSDRSKAAVLRTAIAEETAQNFGNVPPELLKLETEIKADRNRFQSILQDEKSKGINGDSALILKYQNELFTTNRTYDSLVTDLEIQYSQYFNLKYQEDSISIDQLQSSLPQGTVVEYFYTDKKLYSFILTSDRFEATAIPISVNFSDSVRALRNKINTKASKQDIQPTSWHLYSKLITPLDDYIRTNQQLTIIPHGILSIIPFEVLQDSALDQRKGNTSNYLLEKYPISYAFSAGSLGNSKTNTNKISSQFAGFAPSYQPDLLASAKELENYGELRNGLSNLNYTDDEINLAGSFFLEPLTFFGIEATESNFKSVCSDFRVLHLAMHAIVDQENPLLSKLIFTNSDSTSTEDGFLYAREIYNLDLNADMAILSACNTAFGKLIGGEGVMSLGRAFAYAGCPSIIMSLWPAQDRATAEIMGYFYEALSKGDSKDVALRNAKLKYLSSTDDLLSHPFYWANFIVQGDLRPIDHQAASSNWTILLVIAISISIAVFLSFKLIFRKSGHMLVY